MTTTQADSQEVIRRCRDVLNACDDPAEAIVRVGKAMVEIGTALRGMPAAKARAVFNAATMLHETCEKKDKPQ